MDKNIPQYASDGNWKYYDSETGEEMEWVVPSIYAFEQYAEDSLYYSFNIGKEHSHQHDFYTVLKEIFDYPESFNIVENDLEWYTKRQLQFIKKLQDKCLQDGLQDICANPIHKTIGENSKYNIEELRKRNYQHLIKDLKKK